MEKFRVVRKFSSQNIFYHILQKKVFLFFWKDYISFDHGDKAREFVRQRVILSDIHEKMPKMEYYDSDKFEWYGGVDDQRKSRIEKESKCL